MSPRQSSPMPPLIHPDLRKLILESDEIPHGPMQVSPHMLQRMIDCQTGDLSDGIDGLRQLRRSLIRHHRRLSISRASATGLINYWSDLALKTILIMDDIRIGSYSTAISNIDACTRSLRSVHLYPMDRLGFSLISCAVKCLLPFTNDESLKVLSAQIADIEPSKTTGTDQLYAACILLLVYLPDTMTFDNVKPHLSSLIDAYCTSHCYDGLPRAQTRKKRISANPRSLTDSILLDLPLVRSKQSFALKLNSILQKVPGDTLMKNDETKELWLSGGTFWQAFDISSPMISCWIGEDFIPQKHLRLETKIPFAWLQSFLDEHGYHGPQVFRPHHDPVQMTPGEVRAAMYNYGHLFKTGVGNFRDDDGADLLWINELVSEIGMTSNDTLGILLDVTIPVVEIRSTLSKCQDFWKCVGYLNSDKALEPPADLLESPRSDLKHLSIYLSCEVNRMTIKNDSFEWMRRPFALALCPWPSARALNPTAFYSDECVQYLRTMRFIRPFLESIYNITPLILKQLPLLDQTNDGSNLTIIENDFAEALKESCKSTVSTQPNEEPYLTGRPDPQKSMFTGLPETQEEIDVMASMMTERELDEFIAALQEEYDDESESDYQTTGTEEDSFDAVVGLDCTKSHYFDENHTFGDEFLIDDPCMPDGGSVDLKTSDPEVANLLKSIIAMNHPVCQHFETVEKILFDPSLVMDEYERKSFDDSMRNIENFLQVTDGSAIGFDCKPQKSYSSKALPIPYNNPPRLPEAYDSMHYMDCDPDLRNCEILRDRARRLSTMCVNMNVQPFTLDMDNIAKNPLLSARRFYSLISITNNNSEPRIEDTWIMESKYKLDQSATWFDSMEEEHPRNLPIGAIGGNAVVLINTMEECEPQIIPGSAGWQKRNASGDTVKKPISDPIWRPSPIFTEISDDDIGVMSHGMAIQSIEAVFYPFEPSVPPLTPLRNQEILIYSEPAVEPLTPRHVDSPLIPRHGDSSLIPRHVDSQDGRESDPDMNVEVTPKRPIRGCRASTIARMKDLVTADGVQDLGVKSESEFENESISNESDSRGSNCCESSSSHCEKSDSGNLIYQKEPVTTSESIPKSSVSHGESDAKSLASESAEVVLGVAKPPSSLPKGVSYNKQRRLYKASGSVGGRQVNKGFSVNNHGEADAKRLAIEQRLAWESECAKTTTKALPKGITYRKQNRSYVASYYVDGRQVKKGFSVNDRGEAEAKRLAIEQRLAWESECAKTTTKALPKGVSYEKQTRSYVASYYVDGRQVNKGFSVNNHGEAEAKRLAIEQRLAWESGEVVAMPTKKTTTKALPKGVSYRKEIRSYVATCNFDGRQVKKWFSVNNHGEAEAKRLAIEQRLAWESECAKTTTKALPKGICYDKQRRSYKATTGSVDGRQTSKWFSVDVHGEAEAKRLAIEQRLAWESGKRPGGRKP